MSANFKPSQVQISAASPLTATMGRAEVEQAAALIVRACQALGDTWQAVGADQIGRILREDVAAARAPLARLVHNPFFRPDVRELVARGYAAEVPCGFELTDRGLESLRRWVAAPPVESVSPEPT